ncbi:DUF4865 family protein [Solihabitans fulvus]|uniref:DUF4865 family protein n=1 Tax=Solihabitans fulvus TaxID=1892852 RepID=A0A5B2XGD3_9PSEU|nr:DUF4865 family protein [Solihabitans fulvus]KAA2261951.1 DUF4865 family protein [Solihabitans fulvus]
MYAMQYAFTLPADYDTRQLRERVGAAVHSLDDRAGLGLKAYLFRDRGVDGSPVNEYACVYLWNDTASMSDFLVTGSGRFQNIIRFFGRPSVDHWTGIAAVAGPARAAAPKAASRRLTALPTDADDTGLGLAARIERETEELAKLARREDVHTAALAVDPRDWRLLRFVLWADAVPPEEDATERYEVLHVSTPELAELR